MFSVYSQRGMRRS